MIDVPYNVKRALKDGNRPKQYRFQVLNDDETVDFTIDNDTLVKESVKIDERMCSGDRLKFGLCEGASLEFQYFNHPNIRGRRVKVFLDVAYDNEGTEAYYPLSMGYFDVDQCSTQFSTGIIKAVGYNKLRSDYLDQKANKDIEMEVEKWGGNVSISTILLDMLEGFAINPNYNIFHPLQTPQGGISPAGGSNPPFFDKCVVKKNGNNYETLDGVQIDTSQETSYYKDHETYIWLAQWGATISLIQDGAWDNNKYHRVCVKTEDIDEIVSGIADDFFEDNSIADAYIWDGGDSFTPIYEYIYPVYHEPRIDDEYDVTKNIQWYMVSQVTIRENAADDPRYFMPNYAVNIKENANKETAKSSYYTKQVLRYGGGARIFIPAVLGLAYGRNHYDSYDWARLIPVLREAGDTRMAPLNTAFSTTELVWMEQMISTSEMDNVEFTTAEVSSLPDVTLRELQSAVYETSALYGQLDRDTDLFYGVELNSGSLTPSASLYPSATLYPNQGYGSNIFRPFPSEYQKLWTDSVGEQTFRYLIITYKAIEYDQQGNPTEVDKTLQRTVHEHGTTNYNCSDNWLFRNLVWTAEQVGAYADAMVEKMRNIRWFPFEMWSTGLPYVEVGDAIEIADKEGDTHISYVLQRQLNGIQNLQDTYINGQLDIF